ncbi:3-ketoacyl-ACP reductase FabG2 [Wohlfahrtiimonas chitiniclastica]|uniref:3-ketoacyl-ACP reductase FabG2 n=1 Tax=Wohlfahrtiimonas chitiniclastica TaxID=400946 RepID=UPI001BCB6EAE|nr:3-ketoacyl-ACP reductase FabG2 [Wohlfahrtiimonas chitiniclastica]MBS7836214.1 3-oxoacyl-ACP reductase FabG [Wohlfahrtiimonas chitiniclastica]
MHKVLVTGASGGLGRAIAERLAQAGYHIVLHYFSHQAAAKACLDRILNEGGSGELLQFDISDQAGTRTILEHHIDAHGAFYGIVNNAGIIRDGAFPALSNDDWNSVIHTNLDSFFNVIHPCIMPMIRLRQGGRIITLSSVSGIMGNRGQVNYSAAKAGVIGATKALAVELASRKITVNCIAPGIIETDMTSDFTEEALKLVPMQRFGKPQEIASLAAYLMSDDAAYLTRQVISVNGGML